MDDERNDERNDERRAFDPARTGALILGGLTDPRATWARYLAVCPGWQQTLLSLTVPLVVGSVLLGWLIAMVFGTGFYWGLGRATVPALVLGLINALIAILLFSFLLSFLAGRMGGRQDFDRGVAAVSLSAVPAYAGLALVGIPWIGWLFSLAGTITSLVFLYRIIPLSHQVPDSRRVLHFVLTLIVAMLLNLVIAAILGGGRAGTGTDAGVAGPAATGGGATARLQQQALLVERMQAQRWDPPADGRVTEAQVQNVVEVLQRARELQQEHTEQLQRLSQEMEGRELSLRDLRRFSQGVDSAMGLQVAEMQAVDEHNGNWAEHRWVRERLMHAAGPAGDSDEATAHNRELLEQYREPLQAH